MLRVRSRRRVGKGAQRRAHHFLQVVGTGSLPSGAHSRDQVALPTRLGTSRACRHQTHLRALAARNARVV